MIRLSNDRYVELAEKQNFAKSIGNVLNACERTSIEAVDYKIFWSPRIGDLCEYLIVTYRGGAIAARNCRGNSVYAIFEEIYKLFNGGYYDEVPEYFANSKDSIALSDIEVSNMLI